MTAAPIRAAVEPTDDERDDVRAQSHLWAGIKTALMIEMVLCIGVLVGALAVSWWPHP